VEWVACGFCRGRRRHHPVDLGLLPRERGLPRVERGDGRREPSSSQFGRLIAALDPAFIIDVYGDDVETMRSRYEDVLAQAREAEARARAALEILRGGTR